MPDPEFKPKTAWRLYLLPGLAFLLAMALVSLSFVFATQDAQADDLVWPKTASIQSDGLVYDAQKSADLWWASIGVHPCANPAVYSFDQSGAYANVAGMALYPWVACRYGISDTALALARQTLATRTRPEARRAQLAGLWALIAHERGHNAGLTHADGGIMDPTTFHAPPGAAFLWANSIISTERQAQLARLR